MPKLWSKLQAAIRSIRVSSVQAGFAEAVLTLLAILIVLMAGSLAYGYYVAVNYEGYTF